MPIRCTKHVYAPPEADDGCRIIVMRRYPRGVAKWRAHGFLSELAPTLPLVHWYHEQKNAIEAQWRNTDPERFGTEIARFWRVYSRRYLSEMRRQRPLIEWLSALERDFGLTLTLLCACHDHRLCHRSLLADLITESPSPPTSTLTEIRPARSARTGCGRVFQANIRARRSMRG